MASMGPGARLAAQFYERVLAPELEAIPHGAALMGEGSEVLGYDTERSRDHGWGPRACVFVDAGDVTTVRQRLDADLPEQFGGWPVRHYRWQSDSVDHHVEVDTLEAWTARWLGFSPRHGLDAAHWLALPQQLILGITAGPVFNDDLSEIKQLRSVLSWYPDDVWVWLQACEWERIAGYESFVGRCTELRDRTGATMATANVVRHALRLALLQGRRYAPYDKWLATAARGLDDADTLAEVAERALTAADPTVRDESLSLVYDELLRRHNNLDITEHIDRGSAGYIVGVNDAVRPYIAVNATRIAHACSRALGASPLVRLGFMGSIDQLGTPTDELIGFSDWPSQLRSIYAAKLGQK